MADTDYDLTTTRSATNRYTAASDVDVLLSASGGFALRWSITPDDTVPTVTGHPLEPNNSQALQLKTGDRLWMWAEGSDTKATLGVLTP